MRDNAERELWETSASALKNQTNLIGFFTRDDIRSLLYNISRWFLESASAPQMFSDMSELYDKLNLTGSPRRQEEVVSAAFYNVVLQRLSRGHRL